MKIAICDDELAILNSLEDLLKEIFDNINVELEISTFSSGRMLLNNIEQFDAAFLDVEMPGMDGFQVGKEIKEKNPECRIIMATAIVNRFKESFYINAFRYITKPFDIKELNEAVEALIQTDIEGKSIEAFFNRKKYNISQKKIQYIHAYSGFAEVHTAKQTFRIDKSLNKIEENLDSQLLIRIHRTYIINVSHITEYNKEYVMIAGEKIAISRRKLKKFEKCYLEYKLKYGRD